MQFNRQSINTIDALATKNELAELSKDLLKFAGYNQPNNVVITDYDDTLVLTQDAVVEAYGLAGANNPEIARTHHWTEHVDARTHREKNRLYKTDRLQSKTEKTAVCDLILGFLPILLTSSSEDALFRNMLEHNIHPRLFREMFFGKTKDGKLEVLSTACDNPQIEEILYIDDDYEFLKNIQELGFKKVTLLHIDTGEYYESKGLYR